MGSSDRKPPIKIEEASIDPGKAGKAIQVVDKALKYMVIGPPIIHMHPHELHIDIPILYNGYALDRIHYDPIQRIFLPKGCPGHFPGISIDREELKEYASKLFDEVVVGNGVEYREPEKCWVVPLVWRNFIIAHIKVSHDAESLIPDIGLTGEIRRMVE